jgi:hypothetical protein
MPRPPPRQTVRADFPHTAFARNFSIRGLVKEVAKPFMGVADRGHGRGHKTIYLPEVGRLADFGA